MVWLDDAATCSLPSLDSINPASWTSKSSTQRVASVVNTSTTSNRSASASAISTNVSESRISRSLTVAPTSSTRTSEPEGHLRLLDSTPRSRRALPGSTSLRDRVLRH